MKSAPTLLGVVIGVGATVTVTAMQRHWHRTDKARERQEKARELMMSRGEELLDQCLQLAEWKETARKVASTGEWQGFVPIQGPMFRIAAIVELFFPELSDQAQTLDNVVANYLHYLRGMAMKLQAGGQVSQPQVRTLHEEQERVEHTLGTFQEAARKLIRARIDQR